MNPDTHQFERLDVPAKLADARSKGWKIFKTGEKVTVNGTDFSVADIQPNKLTLRPWRNQTIPQPHEEVGTEIDQSQFPVKMEDLIALSLKVAEHGPELEISPDATIKSAITVIDRLKKAGDSESHHHAVGADLRSFPQADIDNWFSYHAPTPEQIIQYGEIRTAAKIFAETINRHVPASADKTAAMRELRGCVMAANLAIACYKKPTIESLENLMKSDEKPAIEIHTDGSITAD